MEMENEVETENSKPRHQGVIPGCMRGIFLSFDIHHGLRLPKMLGERSAYYRRLRGMSAREMTVTSVAEIDQSYLSETEANEAGERANSDGKASDKSRMRRLNPLEIYKKYGMFRQKSQKQKLHPSSRRFSRTFSIHHLECNDYVPSDERKPEEDELLVLHDSDSPCTVSPATSEISTDKTNQSREKLRGANIHLAQEDPKPGAQFTKSHSFPGQGSPKAGNIQSQGNMYAFRQGISEDGSSLSSSLKHAKSERDNGSAAHQFKDLKQRIHDVLRENQKGKNRISLDGILHKVPYGSSPSQEMRGERSSLLEGPDAYKSNSFGHVRRSRSLTESLERYASLLESNSSNESKQEKSDNLRLVHEESGFQVKKLEKTFERISSLPEFESNHFGKDYQKEVPHRFLHSRSMSVDLALDSAAMDRIVSPDANCDELNESMAENIIQSSNYAVDSDFREKLISASIVDSSLLEKSSSLQGSEMKTASDECKEQSGSNDSLALETDVPNANRLKMPGTHLSYEALHARVEAKHVAEFLHLVDTLKMYWSSSSGLPEMDLSLSPNLEGLADALESDLDPELLNDLTHEILLEILESSYGIKPVIHAASYVLERAWANITWHLECQQEADEAFECIVERDFKRSDGWMKLDHEVEDVGKDLEALLLDDLMDEALTDFLQHRRRTSSLHRSTVSHQSRRTRKRIPNVY